MDAVTLARVDAHGKTTREVNGEIRALVASGQREIEVLNPGSRHNLAVGILEPVRIVFRGDVGYFCGGLSDGLDLEIEGDAGWSLGADMMTGKIVVHGSSGSSTAPSIRGGLVVVMGDAGARTAIALKGGTVVVGGSTGYMTGFMMQKGTIVVCGDAEEALADSMYEGRIFVGGKIAELGNDAVVKEVTGEDREFLRGALKPLGLSPDAFDFKKVESGRRLWNFDKKEFTVWKAAL